MVQSNKIVFVNPNVILPLEHNMGLKRVFFRYYTTNLLL